MFKESIFFAGNVCNRLLQSNAAIAREVTCCKMFVRHRAKRKTCPTKFPLGEWGVNDTWPVDHYPECVHYSCPAINYTDISTQT